jgi:hypothetical protein
VDYSLYKEMVRSGDEEVIREHSNTPFIPGVSFMFFGLTPG